MSKTKDMARLAELSQMIFDAKLAELSRAAAARSQSLSRLADLATPPPPAENVTEARAALLYQKWADARRAEINRALARQTAQWLEAKADAATAFGRADVLARLSGRR
jgi:hypothetical protein